MTATRRYSLALVFLFGLAYTQSCSEPPDRVATLRQAERWAELEILIPALMDSGAVTGLSMAIVNDSAIVWSRGFGVRSLETSEPVDESSVFEAASLSKPVFTYAVLQLVDQRLLDLETPIAEYYDYEAIAYDERHTLITPRMVLTHSTGFPNWRPNRGQLAINFEPGSEFSYSGEGFGYLQMAVMQITGEPLQELMERLVFEPLGMTNSSYIWDDRFEANLALPHNADGEVTRKGKPGRGRGHAAATLHTTAPDFARFLIAAMNGTGLSDSMAVAMLTPQIEVDSGVTWGLGIGLQENETGRGFWHWGDNTGYKAYTLTYPDRGVGMIWFTNSENGHSILEAVLAETVGGEHPAAAWLDYESYDSPRRRVREAVWQAIEEQGVEAGIATYRQLKASQPAEAFHEYVLNMLGYRLMRSERIAGAIEIFKLTYMEAGELELAIANYEKSLELNPDNTNAVAMLERIRSQTGGRE
jgi:CubicO group peptidase (beta-lactamase class C family)